MGLFNSKEEKKTNVQRPCSASTTRSSTPGYDSSYARTAQDPRYSASSSSRYDSAYGTTPRPATATSTGYSYTSQSTATGRTTTTTTNTAPSRPPPPPASTNPFSDAYVPQRQTSTSSSSNGYPYEYTARDRVTTTSRNSTAYNDRLASTTRPTTTRTTPALTPTVLPATNRAVRSSITTQSLFSCPNYIPESADGPTGGPPRSHSFFKVRSQKEIDPVNNLAKQLPSSLTVDDNRPGTKAVIVGKPNDQCCIVQTLPEAGESQWLILDAFSMNLTNYGEPLPGIQTIIKILKMEPHIVPSSNRLFQFKLRVLEYVILERPPTPEGLEVVAVANFDVGVVTVVGHSFWDPTIVQWDNDKAVDKCDFVIGEVNRLKDFHEPQMVNGIVCYIKNLREEREYKEKVEKAKKNKDVFSAPLAPKKRAFLTEIRPLTQKENMRIKTYCRDVDGLQLDWARLYIRDVCIATSRLEGHIKKQLCEEHTIIVDGDTDVDRSGAQARLSLTVQLTAEDVKKCLKSQSQETWRVGGDLSIKHPELERFIDKMDKTVEKKYEGGMTVEHIKYEGDRAVVRLRPHPRSYDLFDLIAKTKSKLTGKFTVGPMDDGTDTIASNLFLHFDRFFANKPLFDAWRGRGAQVYSAIPDKNKGFTLKEGKALDQSQTLAMRTVMARDKYVCIEAPPGSGKTLLISAIVAASHQAGNDGAMCVSATTNNAISNAIDIVHDLFPEIKVVREYSRTTEGEISQKSKKISLKEMALKAGELIDLSKETRMASTIEGYYKCKADLAKVRDMTSGLQKLDDLNKAYSDLREAFLTTYRPYLMGSTCELIARRGDPNAENALKCNEEDEKLKKKKYDAASITHLILDEASQLPPHLALAVYVSLPALKKITLIGDSAQLGPYTPLEEKTRAYEMVKFGELERLGDMATTTKVHLWTVYRSHPRIVDLLLKPIYGQELIAGLHHKHRAIASEKSLPAAQDHHDSPVLFVNVENAKCERGVNEKEMEVVLVFIEELRKKKLSGEDVAIVCNHRAQRERITDRLKGKGDIGILNTSVAIHTVDSFQGKEAKIVLVLTTKACSNPKQAQRVFEFVANPNRGTVAVSRAQHAVYLFGDWKMLVRTVFWAKFVPGIMESKCMVDSVWKPSSDTDYRKLSDAAATAKGIGIGGQFPHQGRRPDRGNNKENRGNYRNNKGNGNGNGFMKINGNGGGDGGRGGRGAARGGGRGRGGRRGNNQNTPIPSLLSL